MLALGLAIGVATGLLNGFLVTKRQVSPFLATLATMIVLQGVRFAWTHGAPSGSVPPIFRTLGAGSIDGMPYNIFALLAVAAVAIVLLHKATFGRQGLHHGRQSADGAARRHPGRSRHHRLLRHLGRAGGPGRA